VDQRGARSRRQALGQIPRERLDAARHVGRQALDVREQAPLGPERGPVVAPGVWDRQRSEGVVLTQP
jgi:hypothetical protein